MKYKDYANYAYTAGLLDGEGCIHIDKKKPRAIKGEKNPVYVLKIFVNMTDGKALDFLYGFWGGAVRKQEIKKENHNDMYHWYMECGKAANLLKKCLPFFKTKLPQAQLAIQFRARQESAFRKSYGKWGSAPYPQHTLDFYEGCKIKLQELKKDLKPSNAVAETKRTNRYDTISDSPNLTE